MPCRQIVCLVAILLPNGFAEDTATDRIQVVDIDFENSTFGKPWHINTGEWKIKEGALHGRELKADKHSAALRYPVETRDAVYELRFRISSGLRSFHFGFDPKRGSLDKKGHLFSVIVTPESWKIMKHVDKNRPQEDPNENLALAKVKIEAEKWYTLRVETAGETVTAELTDQKPLKASHSTFNVPKPTLVFRCVGDGVQVDDIRVWARNPTLKSSDGK